MKNGGRWIQCSYPTKCGARCPINADRVDALGRPVCHVHDQAGLNRRNAPEKAKNAARREARMDLEARQLPLGW